MHWVYIQEIGNILIIVDDCSAWIEAFMCGDWPKEKALNFLSAIFSNFEVPHISGFDNENPSYRLHQISESRLQSKERSNGFAELAVQSVKKAMRAWNLSLRVSFHKFLQQVLFTYRTASSGRGKPEREEKCDSLMSSIFPMCGFSWWTSCYVCSCDVCRSELQ